jgi:hypothetical protein
MATLTSLPQRFSKNDLLSEFNDVFSDVNGNIEIAAFIVGLVIFFGIWAWWLFTSFTIIELHRSLKPSRKCKKAMTSMDNAQSTQDLDRHLQTIKGEFPKYERAIEVAYHKKKNSLLLTSSPN